MMLCGQKFEGKHRALADGRACAEGYFELKLLDIIA